MMAKYHWVTVSLLRRGIFHLPGELGEGEIKGAGAGEEGNGSTRWTLFFWSRDMTHDFRKIANNRRIADVFGRKYQIKQLFRCKLVILRPSGLERTSVISYQIFLRTKVTVCFN